MSEFNVSLRPWYKSGNIISHCVNGSNIGIYSRLNGGFIRDDDLIHAVKCVNEHDSLVAEIERLRT